MSQGLTLYGSEDVVRAAVILQGAAGDIARAAGTLGECTRTLEQLFGQGYGSNLDKLIEAFQRKEVIEAFDGCSSPSLTLRDQLAADASEEDIKEMMLGDRDYRNCRGVEYTRQQARYRHADAMLKARNI